MLVKEALKVSVNLQYQIIKLAWSQYQSAPESLPSELLTKLEQQARVAQKIMVAILASEEAKSEHVEQQEVQFIVEQLQQQFDNKESYQLCLQQQGLTQTSLHKAIYQDLLCEKTLTSQSLSYSKVTEQEAITYYENNKQRFVQLERRKVSHILITINDQFAENERQKALAKIEKLHHRLQDHLADFANLALQHSECPTSLNKGLIGEVTRGQLHEQLDSALFNMQRDQLSSVIETEIGFHLLLCHEVLPAEEMHREKALPEICAQLNLHRQKKSEKKWLSKLLSAQRSSR